MRRLTLFTASIAVALGIAASTATADVCACGGGGYPKLVGCAYGVGVFDYGPTVSPRYQHGVCY